MRFSRIIGHTVRMLSREEAAAYVGGRQILEFMARADPPWVKVAVHRQRTTLFDAKALDAACDRLAAGEFPEPRQP
jgi:hypothetical protein